MNYEIKWFFLARYLQPFLTRSRKKELVYQRRMIVLFLHKEAKLTITHIGKLFGRKHQFSEYFLKEVKDYHFEKYYQRETEKFRGDFFEKFGKEKVYNC